MSREYTLKETREEFLNHVRNMSNYWATLPDKTDKERCDGLAFSILVALDGMSMGICGFELIPSFHESDPKYLKSIGENWYPKGDIREDVMMHDEYNK
jgi:hypothetical protein